MQWFYEWTLWVRNHPVLALGLLASIITIVPVISRLIGPPRTPEAIVIGANRESLRETHGVWEVSPLQEGSKISQLPNGVFGFTTPWSLSDPSEQAAGDVTLGAMGGTADTEIHKTREGKIFVLVYVDEISLPQLQNPERVDTLNIPAFLTPREESTDQLIAIPLSRLNNWEDRGSSEYDIVDITVN